MTARRLIGTALLALPLLSFLFLLIISPAAAGWLAKAIPARLTDPIILLEVFLSTIAGAASRSLIWPLLFAIVGAGLRVTISYRLWVSAGGGGFLDHASHAAEYALVFAICGYLLGRALSRSSTQ